MQLIVEGRDPSRLRAICRELADRAQSPIYSVAEPAVHALGFAGDVEAVPFLAEVSRNKSVAP